MAEEVKIKNRKKLRKERVHVSLFFFFVRSTWAIERSQWVSRNCRDLFLQKKALLSTKKNKHVVIFHGIPHRCV